MVLLLWENKAEARINPCLRFLTMTYDRSRPWGSSCNGDGSCFFCAEGAE